MHTREVGNKGEDIGCIFLRDNGFIVIGRNYQKRWGELDIIAKKDSVLHFFEVKSVTTLNRDNISDSYRPEDNVHAEKARRIKRMIGTYLAESGGGQEVEFHFHVLCVFIDMETRKARVKWIKDLIL
jgi:putative endonuclease